MGRVLGLRSGSARVIIQYHRLTSPPARPTSPAGGGDMAFYEDYNGTMGQVLGLHSGSTEIIMTMELLRELYWDYGPSIGFKIG